MTPREELESLRRLAELEAKAQGGAPMAAEPVAAPQNPNPSAVAEPADETMGQKGLRYLKEAGGGAMYAGQKASAGLTGMLPRAAEEWLVKKGLSPSQEQLDAGKQFVQETGPASTIGQMGADVGMQMLPSSMIAKVTAPLTAARAVTANIAGQGGLNAVLTPTSEGRGQAAAAGAGGQAVGGLVGRIAGGPLRTMVSKEAKQLMDAGIPLTPGQAVSGPNAGKVARAIRGTEDAVGSIPIVGDVIRGKTREAANAFSTHEINKALAPIGAKVEGVGHEAIDNAMSKISATYTNVLPDIHVPAASLPNLVDDAIAKVRQTNPLFNTTQEEAVRLYDGRRIQELVAQGGDLTGATAQKIDQELGEYIRKFSKKNTVYDDDLAQAFKTIQDDLRAAMIGATPEAKTVLENARKARAKIQSIVDTATPSTGEFTAKSLVTKDAKAGNRDKFREAAASVLPAITPDSGTAGRALIAQLLSAPTLGAGAAVGAAGGGVLPMMAGAAGAAAAYTKPGMKYLTEGVHPVVDALRRKANKPLLDRAELEYAIQNMVSQPIRAGLNTRGE